MFSLRNEAFEFIVKLHFTPLAFWRGVGGEASFFEFIVKLHSTPLAFWRGVGGEASLEVRLL